MATYPTSVLEGTASQAFMTVLAFHLKGTRVLDLTYGTGLSWPDLNDVFGYDFELTKSDIKPPYSQNLFTAPTDRPDWIGAFDLVYYDPPWYVDIEKPSDDKREDAYGGYADQPWPLADYMVACNRVIPLLLRPGGKVVVKCGDQYHVPSRRLLLHHLAWCQEIGKAFDLVDLFVYRYHRTSPTAYQVKDRPSSVIQHSYFIVGKDTRPEAA